VDKWSQYNSFKIISLYGHRLELTNQYLANGKSQGQTWCHTFTLSYLPSLSLCGSCGSAASPCDDARTSEPLSTGVDILLPTAKTLHNLNAISLDPLNFKTSLW